MLVSGNITRSIADQTGVLGFNINASMYQNGTWKFGFSGSRTFEFTMSDGRIYDPNNLFVGGYEVNTNTNISGQLFQNTFDYFINSQTVALAESYASGYTGAQKYSSWYLNTNGVSGDFDIDVYGQIPSYSIQGSGNYFGSGNLVTGNIINLNPEIEFRIFDVQVNAQQTPYFITGFTTGSISTSGQFLLGCTENVTADTQIPITFYTNFGQIELDYIIRGMRPMYSTVYLSLSPMDTEVTNGQNIYSAFLANYPNTADVQVSLSYISGFTGNVYQYVSTSNFVSSPTSGIVSGDNPLVTFYQGVVTGYDSGLHITQSGDGSGYLYTQTFSPTGTFYYNYVIKASGLGAGIDNGHTFATGQETSEASGFVGLLGGYSAQRIFTNESGYDASGDYIGIIANATGQAYLYPTGYFRLEEPLIYGSGVSGQYVSGNLVVSKIFEGWVYVNYSLLAVGYATGETISGKVDSTFSLNFEPGYYVFRKGFYGLVSGEHITMSSFDPTLCVQSTELNSGLLDGFYSWPSVLQNSVYNASRSGGYLDCLMSSGLPTIPVIGTPSELYDNSGNLVSQNEVFLITPNEGFWTGENSDNALLNITRTTTSRMGITPSGSGYFNQIVNECIDPLTFNTIPNVWRESLSGYPTGIENNPLNTDLAYLSSDMSFYGSGVPSATGEVTFTISGDDKQLLFRTTNGDDSHESFLYLYGTDYKGAAATGSLTMLSGFAPTGTTIYINGNALIYATGSGYSANPYFSSLSDLAHKLNGDATTYGSQYHVYAYLSGDANTLYLKAYATGSYYAYAVSLGGDGTYFGFSDASLVGGRDIGTANPYLITSNRSWTVSDYVTQYMLAANNLTPTNDNNSAIGIDLISGDYTLVTTTQPIDIARGTLSFSTGTFSGCENWPYLPLTINRNDGTYGAITGEVDFYANGQYIATKGVDYEGTAIPFYFGDGQTSTTIYVPLYYKGLVQNTYEQFSASMSAYYQSSSSSAINGISVASALIYKDTVYGCSGVTPPPSPDPIVTPTPYFGQGGMGHVGDTHIVFMTPQTSLDMQVTPFNIDDNTNGNRLVWFYIEDAEDNTYMVEYDQQPFPEVVDTFTINNIYITTNGKTTIITPAQAMNEVIHVDLAGFLSLKIRGVSGGDCIGQTYAYLEMQSTPSNTWYNAKTIGGVFYYLFKKASLLAGPINTDASGGVDGITNFLSSMGLTRLTFENASTSKNMSAISEGVKTGIIANIVNKWNQLYQSFGYFVGDWDPVLLPCGTCYDINEVGNDAPSDTTCNADVMWSQSYTNPFKGSRCKVTFKGGVDDEFLYNGEVYEAGWYPFITCNGAHGVSFSTIIEDGETFTIGQANNYSSTWGIKGKLCLAKIDQLQDV